MVINRMVESLHFEPELENIGFEMMTFILNGPNYLYVGPDYLYVRYIYNSIEVYDTSHVAATQKIRICTYLGQLLSLSLSPAFP